MAVSEYGYSVVVAEGYDEAIVRTRLALRAEGFSILTEMHVGGLLGPEAGDERQYLFMGAWDTGGVQMLADGARVAVQLPCNVVVQDEGPSGALVAALDPAEEVDEAGGITPGAADEARAALGRVLRRVVEPWR